MEKQSYKSKVLKQLNGGKRVTTDSIYADFHTHEGQKVISEIRADGIIIQQRPLPAENGKKPRNEYWIEQPEPVKKTWGSWLGVFRLGFGG